MREYIPVIFPFIALYKIFRLLMRQPEFRGLLAVEFVLLGSGMLFYSYVEKWSWLDSLYFCVVTLATVGYGDLHPTTEWGKLFAIPYIIVGVAMLGVFIQIAGKTALQGLQERGERMRLKEQEKEEQQAEKNADEK